VKKIILEKKKAYLLLLSSYTFFKASSASSFSSFDEAVGGVNASASVKIGSLPDFLVSPKLANSSGV
jgi:hypothetical protein